jgi:membrane-associated phospholipid phosphatase
MDARSEMQNRITLQNRDESYGASGPKEPRSAPPLPMPLVNRSMSLDIQKRPGILLWAVVFAGFSVPLATLIDIPLARWFEFDPFPGDFVRTLELIRFYAHGSGVFFIFLSLFLLAPDRRSLLPRLVTMVAGASAVATIAKMFVLRLRPSQINLDLATVETAWWWRFDWSLEHVAMFDASSRSFPSGNMATAIALTIGLCLAAPRGRWLFVMFCGLTVLQRMQSGSHFFSDVIGGVASGLLWSYFCLHPKLLGSLFDKLESGDELPRRSENNRSPFPVVDHSQALDNGSTAQERKAA